MIHFYKCAATFAALALSLGLGLRTTVASYGSIYLYETVIASYPVANSFNRYLVVGPFDTYIACTNYIVRIPNGYELGIVRSYACGSY